MFLCRSDMQMAPSLGLVQADEARLELGGLFLVEQFQADGPAQALVAARQTFDMLPWPVRPSSSKRLSTSMIGRLLLGLRD